MNREQIIEILNEWNFWNRSQDVGLKRPHYLTHLQKLSATGQIVTIIGVRRSGKSTLMLQYIKELIDRGCDARNTLYLNLEDPKFLGELSAKLLQQIYDTYREYLNPSPKPYIFLDEVQNIPAWEKFVRVLHERKECVIFVSGSNSKLLSSEFGNVLTGRHVTLTVYPLCFNEFLYFKGIKIKNRLDLINRKIEVRRLLNEYIEFGGFPNVVLHKEKREILVNYFDDIISRDVIERNKIKETEKLKTLAKYYLTNISSLITFNKIKKFLGIPLNTIERFSSGLSYPYLIFFIKKFSYSLKEQEVNPRKVYAVDTGLRNAVCFKTGADSGKLYENIVFMELVRKNYDIYYWRDKKECDFLIKKGKETEVIQVCYEIDNPETKQREITGLLEALTKYRLNKGIIITDNYETEEKVKDKKIIFKPLWKWLCEDDGSSQSTHNRKERF